MNTRTEPSAELEKKNPSFSRALTPPSSPFPLTAAEKARSLPVAARRAARIRNPRPRQPLPASGGAGIHPGSPFCPWAQLNRQQREFPSHSHVVLLLLQGARGEGGDGGAQERPGDPRDTPLG